MYPTLIATAGLFALVAHAARPFIDEPNTAQADQHGTIATGGILPNPSEIVGFLDFDFVAKMYMNLTAYTYYRAGAAGEWSYRNNLEVFPRMRFRLRVMVDINNIESTLNTTILGHNFSAPFFFSPCGGGGYANEDAELGLTTDAAKENLLYIPSDYASKSKAEVQTVRADGQVMFQQLYIDPSNDTAGMAQVRAAEAYNFNAILLTVDSPADADRHRAIRFGVGSADMSYTAFIWSYYQSLAARTSVPIITKGIQSNRS